MPYILPSAKHPALRLPGTTGLGLRPSLACSAGIASSGQQQWLTRNTHMGAWYDPGVWNMVFVGSENSPSDGFPNTTLSATPRIAEKPYLTFDENQQEFQIQVPALKNTASIGPDWGQAGTTINQDQFFIAKPSMTSQAINDGLKKPNIKALIFTPGQYNLSSTIQISQPNTVVLGLGVPVLTGTTSSIPIMTTSAVGVKISGLLFEAGSNAPIQETDASLLQIGEKVGASGDINQPVLLSDVYCRIGGHISGQANSCITINDNYALADNLWLWRADHANPAQGSQDKNAGKWNMMKQTMV